MGPKPNDRSGRPRFTAAKSPPTDGSGNSLNSTASTAVSPNFPLSLSAQPLSTTSSMTAAHSDLLIGMTTDHLWTTTSTVIHTMTTTTTPSLHALEGEDGDPSPSSWSGVVSNGGDGDNSGTSDGSVADGNTKSTKHSNDGATGTSTIPDDSHPPPGVYFSIIPTSSSNPTVGSGADDTMTAPTSIDTMLGALAPTSEPPIPSSLFASSQDGGALLDTSADDVSSSGTASLTPSHPTATELGLGSDSPSTGTPPSGPDSTSDVNDATSTVSKDLTPQISMISTSDTTTTTAATASSRRSSSTCTSSSPEAATSSSKADIGPPNANTEDGNGSGGNSGHSSNFQSLTFKIVLPVVLAVILILIVWALCTWRRPRQHKRNNAASQGVHSSPGTSLNLLNSHGDGAGGGGGGGVEDEGILSRRGNGGGGVFAWKSRKIKKPEREKTRQRFPPNADGWCGYNDLMEKLRRGPIQPAPVEKINRYRDLEAGAPSPPSAEGIGTAEVARGGGASSATENEACLASPFLDPEPDSLTMHKGSGMHTHHEISSSSTLTPTYPGGASVGTKVMMAGAADSGGGDRNSTRSSISRSSLLTHFEPSPVSPFPHSPTLSAQEHERLPTAPSVRSMRDIAPSPEPGPQHREPKKESNQQFGKLLALHLKNSPSISTIGSTNSSRSAKSVSDISTASGTGIASFGAAAGSSSSPQNQRTTSTAGGAQERHSSQSPSRAQSETGNRRNTTNSSTKSSTGRNIRWPFGIGGGPSGSTRSNRSGMTDESDHEPASPRRRDLTQEKYRETKFLSLIQENDHIYLGGDSASGGSVDGSDGRS
ncbi:hypothetical protein MKZ38_010679 [Zalerion maritima]|uniref:Uncharacterized protein n=1 Tax=Zalerion maritima TaxID=339359 RepID=A0AAD5RG81_9PEZI|nr:hypothetical protein MKZ38_010679 [Zalerion maritima]